MLFREIECVIRGHVHHCVSSFRFVSDVSLLHLDYASGMAGNWYSSTFVKRTTRMLLIRWTAAAARARPASSWRWRVRSASTDPELPDRDDQDTGVLQRHHTCRSREQIEERYLAEHGPTPQRRQLALASIGPSLLNQDAPADHHIESDSHLALLDDHPARWKVTLDGRVGQMAQLPSAESVEQGHVREELDTFLLGDWRSGEGVGSWITVQIATALRPSTRPSLFWLVRSGRLPTHVLLHRTPLLCGIIAPAHQA